ncbi:hypothetical protein IEQ34_026493 [Dendrobium chrysotoxum]|uniref:AN1-type domain-containing protein n=1 Tax=Dendrobium chrysotoxum TaxID=161865 RepID=A0AAV7FLZ5_DENCH|nr:hypothetical protein IEQ34_026493 [Dendrobium chrysotoxum]
MPGLKKTSSKLKKRKSKPYYAAGEEEGRNVGVDGERGGAAGRRRDSGAAGLEERQTHNVGEPVSVVYLLFKVVTCYSLSSRSSRDWRLELGRKAGASFLSDALPSLLPPPTSPMSTPAFAVLGKHCGVEECELIDFLPFNCDRCDQVFCLHHRNSTEHLCPVANQIDMTLLICPLCAQGVRLLPNEDPDIIWDIHVNCECDPSQKASKKNAVPPLDARRYCSLQTPFDARIATKSIKPDNGFPFLDVLRRSQKSLSAPIQTSNGSAKLGLNFLNAASTIRASAEAGMQKLRHCNKPSTTEGKRWNDAGPWSKW